MAGTGHGQVFKFGSTTLPHVEDVKTNLKGQILSKVVADQPLPITATIPGLGKFTVTFNLPEATPADLLNAIKEGETGAIEYTSDGVKYTAADGLSAGFDHSSPSGGWVTYTADFTASGAVTIAAVA